MVNPRYKPFQAIIEKQREAIQQAENGSRLAHSFGSKETTGWGEFAPEDAIEFDAPYLFRPSVSYGASLSDEDGAEGIRTTRYPRCGGEVLRWDITAAGLYVGAWVIIWVEDRSPFIEATDPDPDPDYTIIHDFTFLGIATKSLPAYLNGTDNGAV